MADVPRRVGLNLWSPDGYKDLRDRFEDRIVRYLRMVVGDGGQLAVVRGHIADSADSPAAPEAARLRQSPPSEWLGRIDEPLRTRARKRTTKPDVSTWVDDAVKRTEWKWPVTEETVHTAMARLALADRDRNNGLSDGSLRIPFGADVPAPDVRASTKLLAQIVTEFGIKRFQGDPSNYDEAKALRDVLFGLVDDVEREAVLPGPQLGALRRLLTDWLNTLHVDPGLPGPYALEAMEVHWRIVEPDALAVFRAYGRELAVLLLENRFRFIVGAGRELYDLLVWLASLAHLSVRDALPKLADFVSFKGRISRSFPGSWIEDFEGSPFGPPPPAAPGSLQADDVAYRMLACREKATDRLVFRHATHLEVPAGWVWPACDRTGIYWWNAILWQHCVKHLVALVDTADFHANDMLRFALLHGLFKPPRDPRVPAYVGACIKTSLLGFKYWLDEPAAGGHKGGEMTFWSENHQLHFHAAQFLAGTQFPDDRFRRSGRAKDGKDVTGREQATRGRLRVERWLDRRLKYGFSEWNSPVYYCENFLPLFNLVDFAPDERMRTKAAMVLDLLIFDFARFTCRGSFAASAGRTYFSSKAFGWLQKGGETIELLFGTRGDHLEVENAAVALCTSRNYEVPDALLAIGLDRVYSDRFDPFADRTRVSVTFDEGTSAGIGVEHPDDVVFWWGLGAYFNAETRPATRRVAETHANLRKTAPFSLLWKPDGLFDDVLHLDALGPHLKALMIDTATLSAAVNVGRAGNLLALASFPLNLLGVLTGTVGVSLTIQSAVSMISTLAKLLLDGLERAWDAITFQDPPEPAVPQSVIQTTWEGLLEFFNSGNTLARANLRSFSIGDAMLSSVQNHIPGGVSFQKQSWMATLGCDACVWTNAPMTAASGGSLGTSIANVFKHALLLQGSDAIVDFVKLAGLPGLDEVREEGLFEFGGSICLPKVVQYRDAAIIAYDFGLDHGTFSKTPTHAWFPTGFFDEVSPRPVDEKVLAERDGGGTWVFARKDDGFVALYSARRVHWVRDGRFDGDPAPGGGTVGTGPFTSTELRAEDGSNIWVCAIGSAARFGSFQSFMRAVRSSYLHISGVGSLNQLQCTFDMPRGVDAAVGGFRLELFYDDDAARVDGRPLPVDDFPRFENTYVSGKSAGRVAWGEQAYRIAHPQLGLWLDHDVGRATRTPGPRQTRSPFRFRKPLLRLRQG